MSAAFFNPTKGVGYCHRCRRSILGKDLGSKIAGEGTSYKRLLPDFPNLVDAWAVKEVRHYLYGRGVDEDICPLVEYASERNRLFFRIWSPSPEFVASWTTRSIHKKGWFIFPGETKRKHYVFGGLSSEDPGEVCLVEGVWDALKVGVNAIALLGTMLTSTHLAWLRGMKKKPRVHVFMDQDDAGREADGEIRRKLIFYGFDVSSVDADREPGDYANDHPILKELRKMLDPVKTLEGCWT